MKVEKPTAFGPSNMPKAVLFGAEGSGKSTLASKLDNVLILDVEGGLSGLNADSVKIQTWPEFVSAIKEIKKEVPGSDSFPYRNVVVDSLTALERLLHSHICTMDGKSSIVLAMGGYGKGLIEAVTQTSLVMNSISGKKDLGFWFLCHSTIKNINDPTRGEYASFSVRADKQMAEWVTSWADLVGFVEIDLMIGSDGKPIVRKEGAEVRRTVTVTPRGGLTAKSRIPNLSGVIPVENFVSKVNETFSVTPQKASI